MKNPFRKNSAFTIVELLITIAIVIILASSVVLYLNPVERLAEGRDSRRTNELNQISAALRLVYNQGKIKGNSQVVYLSLPDSSATCGSYSLPQLPSGWSYACTPSATYLNVDGTGWIPVNFNVIPGGSTLSFIPADPRNTQDFYYAYVTNPTDHTFVVTSLLESEKHMKLAAAKDNGYDDGRYEAGSNLSLWAGASGLVGYWPLSEGRGTTTADVSGNGYAGTLINSPAWVSGAQGFGINSLFSATSGAASYVKTAAIPATKGILKNGYETSKWSLSVWAKQTASNGNEDIILGKQGCNGGIYTWNSGYAFAIKSTSCWTGAQTVAYKPSDMTTWHHLVATYDSGYMSFYVDGARVGTATYVYATYPINAYSDYFGIGASEGGSYGFNGYVDEAKIYNRVLSPTEVLEAYKALKQ